MADREEDEQWMRRAIEVARSKGSDPASSPLGSVIVRDGREIAAERYQTDELPDATAHAEMMAIRWACEGTGELELRGATLYSTPQPCGMCTMASIWSKVGRVVYGASREDLHPSISRRATSTRYRSSATRTATTSSSRGAACARSARRSTIRPTLNCRARSRRTCERAGNHPTAYARVE